MVVDDIKLKNNGLKEQNNIERRLEEVGIKTDDSMFIEEPDTVEFFSIGELIDYE